MRCGNCMEPEHMHIKRMAASPVCRKGGVYREATEVELEAGYVAAFPDGPKPIATFTTDPESLAQLKTVFGADALAQAFGPGGRGYAQIHDRLFEIGLEQQATP
jgi:hypothetical protein